MHIVHTPSTPNTSNTQTSAPTWHYEQLFWEEGLTLVAGVDEAGRGAWAGPVTVAAVILPAQTPATQTYAFRDSKKLSAKRREMYADEIKRVAVAYAVQHAFYDEIAELNILGATHAAAHRALAALDPQAQGLITDYLRLETTLPIVHPAKADTLSYSVAAASVLAKTERDRFMCQLDEEYPDYGFAKHKGYGSAAHRQALEAQGVSAVHRRTFAPIARLLAREQESRLLE